MNKTKMSDEDLLFHYTVLCIHNTVIQRKPHSLVTDKAGEMHLEILKRMKGEK